MADDEPLFHALTPLFAEDRPRSRSRRPENAVGSPMGDAAEQRRMTREEYLAFDRASATKHEYWEGEIFAMSGGSHEHSQLQANLSAVLVNALRDRPARRSTPICVRIPDSEKYV